MAKSKETYLKKEKEKKRLQERQKKREKMENRKASGGKGKPFEDMLAYIDENGNISSTPPDPSKRKIVDAADIQTSVPRYEPDESDNGPRQGIVAFFNSDKGFGFINDAKTGERIFVHISQTKEPIGEQDKVSFDLERGDKGFVAVNVQKA